MNPYDPPQTIDRPPPLAEPAPTIWQPVGETSQLPRAAAHCAWAGQLLVLAAFAAAVLLMSTEFAVFFAGLNRLAAALDKYLRLMFGLSLGLLLVGGWFKNMLGQLLFVQRVQDRALAAAYRMLFVLSLVKVSVLAASCFVFLHPALDKLKYLLLAVLIVYAFLQFHTVLLQAQALRRWQVLFARPYARGLLESYKYLSLAAIVVYGSLVWNAFHDPREPASRLILVALLLLAGALVAYAKLYGQLESALKGAGR